MEEKNDLPFQIKKKTIRKSKKLIYRGKCFEFDFHSFKQNSNYFYQNRQHLKNVDNIKLLNDYEEQNINISDDIIETFIAICQNELCSINFSNVIELQFLSYKYEIPQLISITNEYIKKNQKSLVFKSLLFKIEYSYKNDDKNNDDKIERIFIDTKNEEEIIIANFNEYLKDERLLSLPISILYNILEKYYSRMAQYEIQEQEIIEFLFKSLDKYGRDASILFSNIDFEKQNIEMMTRLLQEYSNIFDFSKINSTLLKTTTQIVSDMNKMKETYSNEIYKMKEILEEQTNKMNIIINEYQKMKEESIKREQEREEIFVNEMNRIRNEMCKQTQKYDEELHKLHEKQNEIIDGSEIKIYQKITNEIISNNDYKNLSDESKNYIYNKIIENPIEYETKSFSLSKQISYLNKLYDKLDLKSFSFDRDQFIKEKINEPIFNIEFNEILSKNNIFENIIIDFLNIFENFSIEIKYPSKYYNEMITSLLNIKNEYKNQFNRIKIINIFSGTDKIEYSYSRNEIINECKIDNTVKEISSNSFLGCRQLNKVQIEPGVEKIEANAFCCCSSLEKIEIPPTVISIRQKAFRNCSSLKEISLPSTLENVDMYIFDGCISLRLTGSITSIHPALFDGCESLIYIEIPSSVSSICSNAFYGCKSLGIISFDTPSSIISIQNGAFINCISLKHISIPSSVTSIGNNAFCGCSSLKQISFEITSSLSSIGNNAFEKCSSLNQISIPPSVKSIGDNSFSRCSSLVNILIPSSVISIGYSSFSECTSLKQISIPSSVKSIGNSAFYRCSSLEQISIPSSINISNLELDQKTRIKRI